VTTCGFVHEGLVPLAAPRALVARISNTVLHRGKFSAAFLNGKAASSTPRPRTVLEIRVPGFSHESRQREGRPGAGWGMAGRDIAQLYAGAQEKNGFGRDVLAPECKVLATHGICHDLKGQTLPGDPQAGEISDCNWGGVRRDRFRRGAVARTRRAGERCRERPNSVYVYIVRRHEHTGEYLHSITIDPRDGWLDHSVAAVTDQPEFSAEPLLRQRNHGHGIPRDAAPLTR
jgi:hypothetical protein